MICKNNIKTYIKRFIKPTRILSLILPYSRFGDKLFDTVNFIVRNKRIPKNVLRFNDVIYRNKISRYAMDDNISRTSCKFGVKSYVRQRLGRDACVPTIAFLTNKQEILNYEFPHSCVIKATHASGKSILRYDGEIINKDLICTWLDYNYYFERREVNYRHLQKGVIVEPFVFGNQNPEDYKVFCFRGRARLIQIDTDRASLHKRTFYTTDWKKVPGSLQYPETLQKFEKPVCLQEMLLAAEALSEQFDFVRIDFYVNGHHYLVGEITHFHGNGWEQFVPSKCEDGINAHLFLD